jgi:hypothetical protein
MTMTAELRILGASFHHRLTSGKDLCVSAEICETFLPLLKKALQSRFPKLPDPHLAETFAIDALMNYFSHPEKFNLSRSSLIAYLYMDACGDMLNFLDKQKKFVELHIPFSEHELRGLANSNNQEGLSLKETFSLAEQAIADITDPIDREVIELMLNGVRETEIYAEALHLGVADKDEQKVIVKKHKDRLKVKLKRWMTKNFRKQMGSVF